MAYTVEDIPTPTGNTKIPWILMASSVTYSVWKRRAVFRLKITLNTLKSLMMLLTASKLKYQGGCRKISILVRWDPFITIKVIVYVACALFKICKSSFNIFYNTCSPMTRYYLILFLLFFCGNFDWPLSKRQIVGGRYAESILLDLMNSLKSNIWL